MKYLGYILILIAIAAGYLKWPGLVIVLLAFLSTLIFASKRRRTLKETPMAPDQNMILDGAFLFAGQSLIMFTAYLLGIFAVSPGADLFIDFLTGQRG